MKNSLNVKLGIVAVIINSLAWYGISRSLTYYEVASVSRYCLGITLLLLVIGIFTSVFFHKKENNGFIHFKMAFKTGLLYAFILALGLAIFNFVYYKFIAPDAIDYYVNEAKSQIIITMKDLQPDDLKKFEEKVRSLFSSFRMFMLTLLEGVVISLIVAGVLQKKEPKMPFSEN